MTNFTSDPSVVLVPIKTAWASKVNWTQAIGMASSIAVVAGCAKCEVPPETIAALVVAIQGAAAVATWVFRTWFNGSVSPASL